MRFYLAHNNNTSLRKNQEQPIDIDGLTKLADNSCDYINANNFLDFVDFSKRKEILELLVSKVRKNGDLVIEGLEPTAFSRMFYDNEIDVKTANAIMLEGRKSFDKPVNIKSFLGKKMFSISLAKIDNYKYYIGAKRR